MEFTHYIGIDVSKNELDFAVMEGKQLLFHEEIQNTPSAIGIFMKKLLKLRGFIAEHSLFCMEHTGIYSQHLLSILYGKKVKICLESALRIKNSMGNLRGKNDKVDAVRIGEYAYRNQETVRLWEPKREVIQELSHLAALRSRLVEVGKIIKTPLKENGVFMRKGMERLTNHLCSKTIKGLETDLERVEEAIDQIITSDAELKRLFAIVTSVSSIGKVTAVMILVTTNEFKDIKDPKKFACYAGVAPFPNESGLFKGKPRVSHQANKKMKTLLHLAALGSIQHNEEIKVYYHRKTVDERKNKMSTLNAIRNKLILRIFACVNQNRPFEKNYSRLVA